MIGVDGRREALVNTMYVDGETLWVATANGLFRSSVDGFVEVQMDNAQPVTDAREMHRDRRGRLWVGTTDGMLRIDDETVFRHSLEGRWVVSIAEFEDQLCAASATVVCLRDGQWQDHPSFPSGPKASTVTHVEFDLKGQLWAATAGGGVYRENDGRVAQLEVPEEVAVGRISSMVRASDTTMWLSFLSGGVVRMGAEGPVDVWSLESGLPVEGVESVLVGAGEEVWFGTQHDGLGLIHKVPFSVYSSENGLRDPSVTCVLEDHSGTLWVGTATGGLHRFENGALTADGRLPSLPVLTLAEDAHGRLWVGTAGSGVFVLQDGAFEQVEGARPVVLSLVADSKGRIWAGALGSIQRFDDGVFRDVPGSENVTVGWISENERGIWFANGRGGVLRWSNGEFSSVSEESGFAKSMTVAVHPSDDGGMWVGTHLGGLTYLGDGFSSTLTTEAGLCDDSVFSITDDGRGRLWMTSNHGVFSVPKDQLRAVVHGEAQVVDCRMFGTVDGLRSSECNGGQQPSAWRDRSGRLWFATINGVAVVDPDAVDEDPPPVIIEEVFVDGAGYSIARSDSPVEVPPGRGELSVRFTSLDPARAEQLQFRYRLVGLDSRWEVVGHQDRHAYFTSLPAGFYRLEVQNRISGMAWSEPGAEVSFRLRPAFVDSHWFLLLMAAAAAGLVWLANHGRIVVLRRRQRQLETLVSRRTQELADINVNLERRVAEGIDALRESERLATYGRLVAGVAHEVRHPIFAVRAAVHLLLNKTGSDSKTADELAILERETDRMQQIVDDLLELGRPRELVVTRCEPHSVLEEAMASIAAHPDVKLTTEMVESASLPPVAADRGAVVQVLLNLAHNASRHALGASRVVIGARVVDGAERIGFFVEDDGAGIAADKHREIFEPFVSSAGGTGLGLAIARQLTQRQNGFVRLSSTPGEGSVFTVELPLWAE